MSTTTTTFEWDEQNNLSAMILPDGSREEYAYSADGLRRQKKVNGAVTHYIWDEQNLLQEKDASLQTKVQYTTQPHGYGPLLSQRRFDGTSLGGTSQQSARFNAVGFGSSPFNQGGSSPAVAKSTFYGTDLSGNVRNLTDSSGAVTDRYVTTAFGKPVSSTGSTTNPYRFGGAVGYYQDNAQRYYVRRRYLNTNQARWISPDPIGFNGRDWSLFRYVGNNPVEFIDPIGLSYQRKNSGICGPEIGKVLRDTLFLVQRKFESREWSDQDKATSCNLLDQKLPNPKFGFITAANSWDIQELTDGGKGMTEFSLNYPQCSTGDCPNTVMVYGKCHKTPVVNYILFGFLWKLCSTGYPLENLANSQGYIKWREVNKNAQVIQTYRTSTGQLAWKWVPKKVNPQTYRSEYYTEYYARNLVATYKTFIHPEDLPSALNWLDTGYNFNSWVRDPQKLTHTDTRYCGCLKCNTNYSDRKYFDVQFGLKSIP